MTMWQDFLRFLSAYATSKHPKLGLCKSEVYQTKGADITFGALPLEVLHAAEQVSDRAIHLLNNSAVALFDPSQNVILRPIAAEVARNTRDNASKNGLLCLVAHHLEMYVNDVGCKRWNATVGGR